jgi:hypothetical protein
MTTAVFVQLAHLRTSTATISFMAERSSAGRRAGDSLFIVSAPIELAVAHATVVERQPER